MKRHLTMLIVLVLLVGGSAFAEYHADQDVYVQLPGSSATSSTTNGLLVPLGDTMFDAQEGAHDDVTGVSGVEVDHYYVWICIGDACIPVDPFTVNR